MLARERSSWVWLVALAAVFGGYFAAVLALERLSTDLTFASRIALLGAALTILALIVGIDRISARLRHRPDEPGPDERDRFIELRSASVAYYVLLVGMVVVGCVMPFSAGGWEIVHAALFAVFVAEVVHHSLVVLGYRFGWHV